MYLSASIYTCLDVFSINLSSLIQKIREMDFLLETPCYGLLNKQLHYFYLVTRIKRGPNWGERKYDWTEGANSLDKSIREQNFRSHNSIVCYKLKSVPI